TSSICSPSRGSLLTGRYPQSNGLIGLAGRGWGWEFNDPKQHLSHVLRDAGYSTALFGVQHETIDPTTLGFDLLKLGRTERSEDGVETFVPDPRDPYQVPLHGSAIKTAPEVARDVTGFLAGDTAKRGPFYIQAGFFETHTPYLWGGCEPDDSEGAWMPPYVRYEGGEEKDKLRQHIANLQGSLRRVDDAVETILDALAKNGLEENTLVLFVTDHGPELPGAKWTMYDAGTRIAFIVRWPGGGIAGGRTCDRLLSNIDFLPTLGEITGVPMPDNVEGVSFAPSLRSDGDDAGPYRDAVFGLNYHGRNYGARTEKYSIVRSFDETCFSKDKLKENSVVPYVEFFDLVSDPLEQKNVAGDPAYAEPFAVMKDRIMNWLESVNDPVLTAEA
ncbi:MAG: sulfatase-like hydrolase/transferase, partial [Lentisphaerae bacterium]|nr:sulfatase-like hydrolase/transferase [Lentisphaerota bacterium]